MRIRAPRLTGTWIVGAPPVPGSWVLLHFFTAGCINCRHTVAELAGAYGVTVVGVHSPKFAYEATEAAARSAVARLGIAHPVLHDPDLTTWDAYAVKAWPTLTLVDPDGYVVRQVSGEGHVASLLALAGARRGRAEVVTDDRPGGLALLPTLPGLAGGVLVTLPGRGELVALDAEGVEVRRYGGFTGPQGVHVEGSTAWVADTGSHRVLHLDLGSGEVQVVAGTGEPWRPGDPREGPDVRLSSPWGITRWQGALVVALAGTHQLVTVDPHLGVRVLAGTGREGLYDGPARDAVLAQPSGLAVGPGAAGASLGGSGAADASLGGSGAADASLGGSGAADASLWFVDAESSALRRLTPAGMVETVVGAGLFAWGSADGDADQARLQHPQGVAVLPGGLVHRSAVGIVVADTYNGALRLFTGADEQGDGAVLRTLVTGLTEPVSVVADETGLWVASDHVERLPLPGDVC